MFKSKLMEMCQKKAWSLPEYEHSKEGPAHNLRFSGAVTVNGLTFRTTTAASSFASSKQACNEAARLAFLHFSASSAPDPDPNLSSLSLKLSHPHLFHPPPPPSSSEPFASPSSTQSTEMSTDHHNKHASVSSGGGVISLHDSLPTDVLATMEDPQINFCPKFLASKNVTGCPRVDTNFDHTPSSEDDNKAFQDPLASSMTLDCLDHKESAGSYLDNEPPINGTTIFPDPQAPGDSLDSLNDIIGSEVERRMYKAQLQIYAQKKKCTLPTYTYETEGPSHDRRFKSTVTVDDQTFESFGFFRTKKEADNAAAKVAFQSLSADGPQEDLFKNALLELACREGFGAPKYDTNISGAAHMPVFVSTVTVEGEIFQGTEARSKKLAEISAAKIAYKILIERKARLSPKITAPICKAQNGPSSLIKISDMNLKARDIPIEEQPEKNRVQLCPNLKAGTPSCNLKARDIIMKEEHENNRECQSLKVGAPNCEVQNGSSSLIKAPAMEKNVRDIEIEEQPEKNRAKDQTESVEVPMDAKACTLGPSITSPKSGAATRKLETSSARSEGVSYSSSELSGCTPDSSRMNFERAAGMSSLPSKKIMVLPRSPNMTFPPGANYGKVLPMSNDEWVALDVNPNVVNNSMPGS